MNIFKDDFYIGLRFKYLGITMLVVGFPKGREVSENGIIEMRDEMRVDYVDGGGKLVRYTFSEDRYPALISELNN